MSNMKVLGCIFKEFETNLSKFNVTSGHVNVFSTRFSKNLMTELSFGFV